MKTALTTLIVLLLVALLPVATAAAEAKPNRENVTSDEEALILGFRGKSKYQIVVPDPMPNEAAAASVRRAAELLQAAFSANGIKLEVKKESEAHAARLRITGRTTSAARLEVMLLGGKPEGGHAGNFFREIELNKGSWQFESSVGDFQNGRSTSGIFLPTAMQLHHVAIYTIGTDAALEIESVEVLGAK